MALAVCVSGWADGCGEEMREDIVLRKGISGWIKSREKPVIKRLQIEF